VPEQLVAVVEKSRAEASINALRAEGVYDDDRSVFECGPDRVAIPVTRGPATTDVLRVASDESQTRPETLRDLLRERGWSGTELDRAPSSWAVIGSVVLVRVADAPRPTEVGEALLARVGGADTVLARHGIAGPHREPDVEVLAGEGDTETVHREHGTEYALDLSEVMFSPGNKAERARMGDRVRPGERVLDPFAGIGYFTLPTARAGATVTAVERNPAAFAYLVENVVRNGVTDRVETYRADCREVLDGFAAGTRFDRVVMGHYDAHEYLADTLAVLAQGGTVHLHAATPGELLPERPARRVRRAAEEAGRTVDSLEVRRVKTYSEGVFHVVVDAVFE
jgi:tRNA wybutosine-synthesizing protein 2